MHNSRSIYLSFPIHWLGKGAAPDNVNQISQFGTIHYEPDNVSSFNSETGQLRDSDSLDWIYIPLLCVNFVVELKGIFDREIRILR